MYRKQQGYIKSSYVSKTTGIYQKYNRIENNRNISKYNRIENRNISKYNRIENNRNISKVQPYRKQQEYIKSTKGIYQKYNRNISKVQQEYIKSATIF